MTHVCLISPGASRAPRAQTGERRSGEVEFTEQAFEGLRESETLVLPAGELRLKRTLAIEASNVFVSGAEGGTKLLCPEEGEAIVIRYTSTHCA